MRTIFARFLTLAAALSAAAPAEERPATCAERLIALAPALAADGFEVAENVDTLDAVHSEAHGQIIIRYRCWDGEMKVEIENRGLPNIPFKILLAAGPGAKVTSHVPDWLRERLEAVAD